MNNLSITAWNPKIEGLRGFAILLVFIAHLSRDGSHQWGALGVGIFFIISGYVITGSISKLILSTTPPDGITQLLPFLRVFYSRRARRLLPLAILIIISTYVVSLFDPNADNKQYFLSAIFCLLYIGNLFGFTNGYTDLAPALGHFWSLAVEEQFYLVWPVLFFFAVIKINRRSKLVPLLIIAIVFIEISHPLIAMANKTVWTLPTTYLDLLLVGCLFRIINIDLVKLKIPHLKMLSVIGFTSFMLILLGTQFSSAGILNYFQYNYNFLLCASLFIFALRTNFFNNQLCKFFGKISYSLYCIHWPLIVFSRTFISDSSLMMFAIAGVSILLSELSHRYFESKFYNPQN